MKAPLIKKAKPSWDWPIIMWLLAVHVLAICSLKFFTWSGLVVCFLLYFVTGCLGITFCFHRLLAHRSFRAHPILEGLTAVFGTIALQGSVRQWVFNHRTHHHASDTPTDPHSSLRGFWYSHLGWMLVKRKPISSQSKLVRDIDANGWLKFLSRFEVVVGLQVLLALTLFIIGGASWLLWGVFMRLVCVYHTTWLVNSATHKWGYKNFNSNSLAVNTWWVALLTWGEGWHNNHHRYERVCQVNYRWWEIDLTYWIICFFESLGLVFQVNRFPPTSKRDFIGKTEKILKQ